MKWPKRKLRLHCKAFWLGTYHQRWDSAWAEVACMALADGIMWRSPKGLECLTKVIWTEALIEIPTPHSI